MTHHRFTTSGANHWQRPYRMGEARRQHVFGKIVSLDDWRDLRSEEANLSRNLGEEPEVGITKGTVFLACGLMCIAAWLMIFIALGLI